MLTQKYSKDDVRALLSPRSEWHPFPTARDREGWDALPDDIHRKLIQRGEGDLGTGWPALPATLLLDFARTGNREPYEQPYLARRTKLRNLVTAECAEHRGRFMDEIVDGVWALCEESSWTVPAHLGWQETGFGLPDTSAPYVDLFMGESAALLAWTLYLLEAELDEVSTLLAPRIRREIRRQFLTPLLERDDFVWTGFHRDKVNNWNPWITSNWLAAALTVEDDPDLRARHVARAMATLDNFIDRYPRDGGCDEGPMYWGQAGGALYACLDWMFRASNGNISVFDDPLVRDIGAYIARMQISDRYFVNFADSSALCTPDPGIIYGYGLRTKNPDLMDLGSWSGRKWDPERTPAMSFLGRQLGTLFSLSEIRERDAAPPLPRDVFLDCIQVAVARDARGSAHGFFMAAKGGHNDESHNHNDVGNVVVYLDGKPVIVDPGVETYTAKTFGPNRYDIWTMQSAYHTLPTVNGYLQEAGAHHAAKNVRYEADDTRARLQLDLAGAYPEKAGIKEWIREATLERGVEVVLTDTYALDAITGPLEMNVTTPCTPVEEKPGLLRLEESDHLPEGRVSGAARLHYHPDVFDLHIDPIPLDDPKITPAWGGALTRVRFTARDPAPAGTWTFRLTR